MLCWYMFGDEDLSFWYFFVNCGVLDYFQQEQCQGCLDVDLCVGWKQVYDQGWYCYYEDVQGEYVFVFEQVVEVGYDYVVQWLCQVVGGEQVEGLQLMQLFWYVCWEEQFVDYGGEEYEDDEVVEFQCFIQGGEGQGFVVVVG